MKRLVAAFAAGVVVGFLALAGLAEIAFWIEGDPELEPDIDG